MAEVSERRAVFTWSRISPGSRLSLGIPSLLAYLLNRQALALCNIFDDRGDTLTSANAERGRAVFQVMAAQFIHQRQRHTCATGSQGMADRDGPTVDIGLL